jgi:hypothetical protein
MADDVTDTVEACGKLITVCSMVQYAKTFFEINKNK